MPSFHFVPRPIERQGTARRWSTLAAVGLSFFLGAIVLKAAGASPLAVYKVFFFDSMTSAYNATEIINKTVTLAVIALGLSVGFRANIWNIGAEGQFIVGAISASAVAIYFIEKEAPWVVLIVLLGGGIGGLLWSAIPAFLRAKITVNEILSSLMLVYVAQLLLSYVVHGPLKDPQGYNFPQSKLFSRFISRAIFIGRRTAVCDNYFVAVCGAGRVLVYRQVVAGFSNASGGIIPAFGALCRFFALRAGVDRFFSHRFFGRHHGGG